MSNVRLTDDRTDIQAVLQCDESLDIMVSPADVATVLEPGLEQLIRDLHAERARQPQSPAGSESLPQRYGRFRLIRRLGTGTYGVVHLAHDPVLKRDVALKIPRDYVMEIQSLRRRFVREAQAAARLKHPYIVQVYQADIEGDEAYIAEEYCAGPNLEQWLSLRTTPVPPHVAAQIVANLADAVGCAHGVGVLHRDVKPGNVLLVSEVADDADVAHHIRLADFGLARLLEQQAGTATSDGALIGTFAYMAPEQVHQSYGEVGPQTDVHALGVVLYELLTLQKPFGAEHHSRILLRISQEIPKSPHELIADIPSDLEAICLKCLEKSPARRYREGRELSADLRRFLRGEPVSARNPTLSETGWRLLQRHPTSTTLCASVALATLVVLMLLARHSGDLKAAALRLRDANQQLTSSNEQLASSLADAKLARDEARHVVYAHDMRHAFAAAAIGDSRMVVSLLHKYADDTSLAAYRGVEWEYLWQRTIRSSRDLFRSDQPQYMCALTPDQRRLALVGADGIIRVFSWPEGNLVAEWPAGQGEVNGICCSHDGRQFWTAGDDGSICRWDFASHSLQARFNAHTPELAFELVQDVARGRLFSCGREGTIRIWNDGTGASLGQLVGHTATVDTLQLSPDGQTLYSQSKDETLRFWDLASLTCRRVITTTPHRISYLRPSPDGRWLAASSPSSLLMIFDLQSGAQVLNAPTLNEPTRLCFDDSSRRLFVGDMLGVIRVWELGAGVDGPAWAMTRTEWQAHTDEISYLNWSSRSGELISVSRDGALQAWRANDPGLQWQRELHHPGIRDLVDLPGQGRLLIACRAGLVTEELAPQETQRDSGDGQWLHRSSQWCCVAAANDGSRCAAGDSEGRVAIWNAGQGEPAHKVTAFEGRSIHSLTFSPDGRRLCITTTSASEPVWVDTETGRTEDASLGFPCNRLAVSDDGRLFAAAFEKHVNIALADTHELVCTLPEGSLRRRLIAFLPDARTLVVGKERTAHAYDTRTGHLRSQFLGHQGDIQELAVSKDGKTLATVSLQDATVRLWHISTGEQLASFAVEQRSNAISAATALCCFSDRDEYLAYTLGDDRVHIIRMRAAVESALSAR